ncbi:MAG TPA: hypothetical protein VJN64_16300 [Terriglobales bacterium]|nr:hypothetical protein [Terriglobales bacterium]
MSMFTTRIELHDATWDDYERLHGAMQKAGFSRLITSDDNSKWHMPWAEYDVVGTYTLDQIFTAASNAASTVGKKFALLVSQAVSRRWSGLQKAS